MHLIPVVWLLYLAALWYKKSTSLPKLYFAISNRRGVKVKDLRQVEKHGYKVLKVLQSAKITTRHQIFGNLC